ncbi:MAG: anaerobic ribonucleoside-triphosphate reductase activating protein [Desulfurococcaceae archaeon]
MKLLVAGWKNTSLVDVYGYVSFTIWTCGCNLRCPFCHNWRIADKDPALCREIDVIKILEDLEASRFLVDYIHVTGGEPLLQHSGLEELFTGADALGVKRSLNSNLTVPRPLRILLEKKLVDHVATDLKIPPEELYGLTRELSILYWRRFIESLSLVKEYGIKLELRIPIWKKITADVLSRYLGEIEPAVDKDNTLILLNPLLKDPFVKPRDTAWCSENLGVSEKLIEQLIETLRSKGFSKIAVKSIPGFAGSRL